MGARGRVWGALFCAVAAAPYVGVAGSSGAASAPVAERLWSEAKQRSVRRERSELTRVAQRSMPAVAAITTYPLRGEPGDDDETSDEAHKGFGSGFVIHPDGYVLTCAHVVENAREIRVTLLDEHGAPEEHLAEVVGLDDLVDVALLRVRAPRKLPVLELGSTDDVEIADWVVVIGNPFGLAHSVTAGVVSFKGRTDVVPTGRSGQFEFLQTDASINPGNSGGPVLDLSGHVVAIANAVNISGQGIGFATPIDLVKEVLPSLKREGLVRRAWLGIAVQDITAELAETVGKKAFSGVVVSEVLDESPAAKAGLLVGDIIEGIDDTPIKRAHRLRWKIATSEIGQTLSLRVRRHGKALSMTTELVESPSTARVSSPGERRAPGKLTVRKR